MTPKNPDKKLNTTAANNPSVHLLNSEAVRALLVQVAGGDESAFRTFFDTYNKRFYKAVLKMTGSASAAEEIVQELFMQLWQKRANLAAIENPDSYFFTAVYRKVYRYYKSEARLSRLYQDLIENGTSIASNTANTTEEMVMASESDQLILSAIEKLPAQQKQIFTMSKWQGMSREEIATALHLSPNTVRNHLYQAIKFIKSQMGASYLAVCICSWLLEK